MDAALIANEVVDDLVSKKKKGIMHKLNMEKAYDYVNWNFMRYMLLNIGFENRWCKGIMSCINSALFAILMNGSPSSFFKASKGLRQ